MQKPSFFYRNIRAGELLELFLVAAVFSVLTTRFILHLTGYPSLGGSHFHIAHLLYGGSLMVISLILLMAFLGSRIQRIASVVGGIGFGLFIDELGKFITRDNNYFFEPTIGLIYLVFVILFLLFRSLGQYRRLSESEQLLNTVMMIQEVVLNDLDEAERNRALEYLSQVHDRHPLVAPLRQVLRSMPPPPEKAPSAWQRWGHGVERWYRRIIETKLAITVIDLVFVVKAAVFLVAVTPEVLELFSSRADLYNLALISSLQFVSTAVATGFIIVGVVRIRQSRIIAYNLFIKSLLIDIFITQFFAFYLYQFNALPGFLLNVVLYVILRFLLRQERRLQLTRR
jgi:hypothetical protein